jgi:membrane protease YdiL (CAAX protease family)
MKEEIKEILNIKWILSYWAIILIIYGALLAFIRNYEVLTVFYHLALFSFPLILILSKKETYGGLGFKRGNIRQGILWLSLILIFLVGGTYFRAFLLGKGVDLVFAFSLPFVMTITLGPISEEMFHRGLLQTKLEKILGETWGMVLPAILFALIHVPKLLFAKDYVSVSTPLLPALSNPIASLFLFFGLGMLFGYVYQSTKSIYYAITAHVFVNLIIGILIF